MTERVPEDKIISIKESSTKRRHARNFVWPIQSVPRSNDDLDQVISETTIKKSSSLSTEMTSIEIPAKEDIFISSRMK